MQVNPDAARAYHLQQNNREYLQTVLLNIIENSEASQQSYRSESNMESFNIHDNYSTQSNYNNLY